MEDIHKRRLEEIESLQAATAQEEPNNVFAAAVAEALTVDKKNPETPLLAQEEIEDEDPPRVNLTAVICTAIVAVCATIILCVAKPWRNGNADASPVVAQLSDSISENARPTEEKTALDNEKPAEVKAVETEKPATAETVVVKKDDGTLPLLKTTTTGTDNPYNNLRLVDASSRVLTQNEVAQLNKEELSLARNAIYARHGYQFKNPELKEYFSKQSWFRPTNVKIDSIPFTKTELDNIRIIKAQETK